MARDVKFIQFAALNIQKDIMDEDKKDKAQLQWSSRMGYPRITVFTTDKMQDDNGKFDYSKMVKAPFDFVTLDIFMQRFKTVLETKEEVKFVIDCFNNKFVNNERTNELELVAKVTVGRDSDGVVYLAVTEDNKKKIKFELMPSKYFKIYDKDNDPITDKRILSNLYARAYYKRLDFILNINSNNAVNKDKMISGPAS